MQLPHGWTDDLYLTAEEAAKALNVTVATLYSYVSRKQLRTKLIEGTRKRVYWKADIARVKASLWKRSNPEAPLLGNNTDITLLTDKGPFYRGRSAIEIADSWTLEQTAALLWQTDEEVAFGHHTPSMPEEIADLSGLFVRAATNDKAIALLPFLEHANPKAFDFSHAGMCRTGADVLRWYAAILTDADVPSAAPLHLQLAAHVRASPEVADLLRRLLVLSADHGFGAGTYAVRAVASTGVSAYRAVLAGLTITSGRRSRLGRSETVWRFLREVGDSRDPKRLVTQRLRDGEEVPGFHQLAPYDAADPRAEALLPHIERVFGEHPLFIRASAVMASIREVQDLHPSFMFVNVLVGQLAGFERHRLIYILARCAGWVAHAMEQYQAGEIEPPSVDYRGMLPAT